MYSYLIGFLLSIVSAPEFVVFVLFETLARSYSSLFMVILIISTGGTIGSSFIYALARIIGYEKFSHFLSTYGKKLLLKPSDLEDIEYYYDRWGNYIIFFGRWLPTFRSLVSVPAGLSKMKAGHFVVMTFAGTLAWNTILCSILYAFGAYLEYLEVGLEGYTWIVFSALILLGSYFLAKRVGEKVIDKSKQEDR
ncbi:DedA family protein [Desulfonatronovibrio magnus]|uniref:DedA family protein n=1 Tax=Desulfonatronovibrio magnus TaxID=698827 RepID=UPI000699081A|nr:DedA family protein [Desulfonatronovibrio magnus]